MGELKSAFDIAMEKAERLGKAPPEETKRRDLLPQGEELAARYLKGEGNLIAELSKYDEEARAYVARGAMEVLLRSIDLPRNDQAKRINRRAMEGLKSLKQDKGGVENAYTKLRHLFKHYEEEGAEQRGQAYQRLKNDFEQRLRQEAMRRGVREVDINVEGQPQFQQQWRMMLTQLDSQYRALLEQYKREIEGIA